MNEVEKLTEKNRMKTKPEKGLWSYLVIKNNLQADFVLQYNHKISLKLHLTINLSGFALKQHRVFLSDHLLIKTAAFGL